ncbi:Plasma membrane low glucose sensor [Aspergillus alliaceus]|uniref:Plasma membrane low glucose sensor n=1 Tax=Petromyces alliaceus TaxID=209559 RepID=A0A8H5ZY92_PETAA|nr:Plasma membrane low glucose sensor [Aspergillus burnettii]
MGFLLQKPTGTEGRTWPAILISGFVAFGGILFGYDTGTISGILAMPYWAQTFSTGYRDSTGQLNVTASQSAAIVSILSAGTFFGSLGAAPTGDLIGSRWGLIASNGVFVVGVVLQTIATSIPPFLAGRFFAGFGVGLISALVPLYQSETAPKWIRGFIVGSYQWAITIGLLLASVVSNATHMRDDPGSYCIPIAVQFAWSIILVAGVLILPETPRYLIKAHKREAATKSLAKLRRLPEDHAAVQSELGEIQANHEHEISLGGSSYIDYFRGNIGKRLMTGCLLQGLQQLTGINFIIYYEPSLYAIDKWVDVLFYSRGRSDSMGNILARDAGAQKAAIAFICLFIFFAASWGPVAWVVTGEIFPLKTRAKSLSMTTATNWIVNWALGYATPYLVNYGPGNANLQSKIFFVWSGCCFLCIVFVYFMIYETKGLTLEVDELYSEVTDARKSVKDSEDYVTEKHEENSGAREVAFNSNI